MLYESLEHLVVDAFQAMRPKENLTVTETAEKYHIIRQPGAHSGPWSARKTPYMVEVQDTLTSLDYTGTAFVGPARSGKSASALNWLAQTAVCDPADMLIVHMTQNDARKWSKDDLAKMFRNSPHLRSLLRPGRVNDNTFDKEFLSGMRLTIVWPTANNLSAVTISRVALLDYDRMPDDVDGEGTPFDLAKKRTTTFKRFGMTYVESSPNPNKEIEDPKWMPRSPHQAPPVRGIFEIYNRGDRRKWYWTCPKCKEAFEPDFQHLHYPETEDVFEAGESAVMRCPSCQFDMPPGMKEELNLGGRWVRDGMMLLPSGEIVARPDMKPVRSDIASFWLKGPAAGYQDWKNLVIDYLRAEQAYIETGDEAPLKKAVTADQGNYYISKARMSDRKPEDLKQKAENWGTSKDDPTVPWGVRFLTATVDVQARSFVVQVNGFADNGDMFVIDGFKIRSSERLDADGKNLPLSPFSVAEDWHLLTEQVLHRTYPLADGSCRRMRILSTFCDSGGGEGATHNAYNYWRDLRKSGEGLHRKFALVKGVPSVSLPRASVSWPDSKQTGRKASARGDVPVVLLNSNLLKDMVAAMMQRRLDEPDANDENRGGMLRYADWNEDWFYKQLTNEIRTGKGWENPSSRRNEVFDLTYYAIGGVVRPNDPTAPFVNIQYERINWDNPPTWAAPWDENDQVFGGVAITTDENLQESKRRNRFEELGAKLAGRD